MQSEEELENSDMIGVVKIKDGLFICDEFGAQVSKLQLKLAICISIRQDGLLADKLQNN
jgi:hypothetical protein